MSPQRYQRPPLQWIKRRARKILRCHGVSRRVAVESAAFDYRAFVGPNRPTLQVPRGGVA